jgi:hypothetical protein
MKRVALLVSTLLISAVCASDVFAQDDALPSRIHIDFGPKVGVNLSKLDGTTWDGGYKTNLLGGLFLGLHGNRFGVQIEGLFAQTTYITGKDFNQIYQAHLNGVKDSAQNGQFRLNYFNIPLVAEVRILNRVWLQVGPQYSGIVSVKDKDAFVKDAEALFQNGTVSAVGGLWIEMTRHLNAGARYVMGFSDINNTKENAESWKQRDIQVHIGYKF